VPRCDDCGVKQGKMHHVLCAQRELNKGMLPKRGFQERNQVIRDTVGELSLDQKINRQLALAWCKRIDGDQRGGFRQEMRHARH
jgi:hypothetical protein